MNNLVKVNNKELEAKEYEDKRVVTFKEIDMIHERAEGTARKRFADNNGRFIEGIDYFELSPKNGQTFEEFGFSKFAPSGTLITESGYLMLVKSFTDDLAWDVQRDLVSKYFRSNNGTNLDTTQLSPELQMFNNLYRATANLELEQKVLKQEIQNTKNELKGIRDVVTLSSNEWRKDSSMLIVNIARNLGGTEHIRSLRSESYKLLDERMGVSLQRRLTNRKQKMALEGATKSKIDKYNTLDIISEDKKLVEGYVSIVKDMAVKYGVLDTLN